MCEPSTETAIQSLGGDGGGMLANIPSGPVRATMKGRLPAEAVRRAASSGVIARARSRVSANRCRRDRAVVDRSPMADIIWRAVWPKSRAISNFAITYKWG